MTTERKIVLGSTSPFRKALLDKLGIHFETDSPDVDESRLEDETPAALVARLSRAKAEAVAERHSDALIIGSDQVAVLGDEILGKPGDHERAMQQLTAASGKHVTFLTGLCLYDSASKQAQEIVVPFYVTFRDLSESEINNYLKREQPYNCAGSFKSEALGIALFEKMEGEDPNALIGLPLIKLIAMLGNSGVRVI
ncbi:septum formation protein Maf [Solemya pervernicosa gill symbiont]|uniref:7-methyl-GTP pyrophosphatase n=2 Tax=Gammaproteobacteria incertae sedis TaxID=118884 RepID=A0A1T2L950_9GAMM|nr:Maf family protein [Candidatus Reidiella endopervernicosa]OOZ41611.1 septum formation protein Maf [Solemya pervernicosa gill symbiont]QKQ26894.1 septum formation inhibitor Maf [Candidatus Reidiella endopervernicosa]